jgi:hypothetical protein
MHVGHAGIRFSCALTIGQADLFRKVQVVHYL